MNVLFAMSPSPLVESLREAIKMRGSNSIVYPEKGYTSVVMERVLKHHQPDRVLMEINYGRSNPQDYTPLEDTARLMEMNGLDIQTKLLGIGEAPLADLAIQKGIPAISNDFHNVMQIISFLSNSKITI